MRLNATFSRVIVIIVATVALGAASMFGASGSGRGYSDLESITSTWQIEGFPAVRMFVTFGSVIEVALRDETGASMGFVEERLPAWFRPQPQPQPLVAEVSGAPARLFLEQNYPNPFNPSTMIRYGVPNSMRVKLTVHTLLGSQIRVLVDQWQDAGTYTFDFVAADLPSGAYFYRLQTDMGTITRRMIISK